MEKMNRLEKTALEKLALIVGDIIEYTIKDVRQRFNEIKQKYQKRKHKEKTLPFCSYLSGDEEEIIYIPSKRTESRIIYHDFRNQ